MKVTMSVIGFSTLLDIAMRMFAGAATAMLFGLAAGGAFASPGDPADYTIRKRIISTIPRPSSRRKLCATLVFGHGAGPGCVDWSNAASTMSRVSHRKPQVCHPRKCSGRIRRTMGRGNTRYEGRFGNYPEAYRLTQIRYLSTR